MRKITGLRITNAMRMNNSVNGNPRYRVYLSDGNSYLTEVDGSVGYDIPNYTHSSYENGTFTVTLTNRGHITQLELETQKGQEVNGMTILEITEDGVFLAKWDAPEGTFYTVGIIETNNGIHHDKTFMDGYDATKHYVLLGGTIA